MISKDFSNAQKPDWAGVWGIWGGERYSRHQYPWYRGASVETIWSTIQPERYRFDFTELDNQIRQAAGNGLYITFMIYIAPGCAPEWLYDEVGVERVDAPKPPWSKDGIHPWYFSPKFEPEFKRMIKAVADHIDTYPSDLRKSVIGVQAVLAKSGDPQPYSGTPYDPRFYIPRENPARWWADPEWRDYNRRMYSYFYELYSKKEPEIIVIIKPTQNNEDWAFENMPRAGRKTFSIAQGYHLSGEGKLLFQQANQMKGMPLLRGEFDLAVRDNTDWFTSAPVWNVYWTSLWCLTIYLDIWNQRTKMMDDPYDHVKAFEFFTKWAGHKFPETSIGAWVAFRDDLDCADIERFPEDVHGAYITPDRTGSVNIERFNSIARAFAEYGARQDDPQSAGLEALNIIHRQKGLNDVPWDVWRGNYGMHLSQIKANETSQGYWRVGSKDQPYGRFARGFNPRDNKNAIYLDIDDNLFKNERTDDNTVLVEVEVIYFDSGNGSWDVLYDALDNPDKVALSVTNTNTNRWKTVSFTLDDAYFSNRGTLGSDISIVNSDDQVNKFHMLKILKYIAVTKW